MRRPLLAVLVATVTACSASVEGVTVPAGYSVEVVAEGFDGPTQLASASDGRLVLSQLAGGENDGTGQVVRFSVNDPGDRQVLFDGLHKPTGVAVIEDQVWVMEEASLSRGPIAGGDLEIVLDDLPSNGRSQGTLTVTPGAEILYDTSGAISDGEVVTSSGRLWSIGDDGVPTEIASGFKHAYAHAFTFDGLLWSTEVSDGSFDGEPAADELVLVEVDADHGWPRCVGDNRPVSQYGGTEASCSSIPSSAAVFDPGATPTSVVVSPWDADVLFVALWNRGEVVSIDTTEPFPIEPEVFLTGISHPQALLVVDDRLLVVDFDGGRILAVSR